MTRFGWRLVLPLLVALAAAPALAQAPDFRFSRVPDAGSKPVPKYRYMFGEPARWVGPLRWRYNHAKAPPVFASDPAGTLAQITAALENWTQSCGVTFVYEGETTIEPYSLSNGQPDGINVVGWDTLQDNRAGEAWVWYDDDTSPPSLYDSDITLSVDRLRGTGELRRVATHEWGHALGLSHSNVNGALMSGPPHTSYNALGVPQADDLRGCRCLYGPAAGRPTGFSCSLPEAVDFGGVPIGGASAPQSVLLRNDGNAPLTLTNVTLPTLRVTRDSGCASGQVLAPGDACTLTLVARPDIVFSHTEILTFNTNDGPYAVPVKFSGIDAPVTSPAVVQLVEYFNAGFGHYFVTHLADEIAKLDNGTFAGWSRTGRQINAWVAPGSGTAPVCRFFSARFAPKSSHFYTSFAGECATVKSDSNWSFEGEVFHVALPDAQGGCPTGTQRVYRLYNNGASGAPNHRFTTDAALREQLIAGGWIAEGTGLGVTMCAPI